MSTYNIRKAYENKIKTQFFSKIPLKLRSIIDNLYKSGYMPLAELKEGFGWVYEKPKILNPSKLERTCEDSPVNIIEGFRSSEKTISQIDLNPETSFMLVKNTEDSQIVLCQFKLGKLHSILSSLFGTYEHHRFLKS